MLAVFLVMSRLMAAPTQNQLLFNLNPSVRPPPLPTRFRHPQPIVISNFHPVSCTVLFTEVCLSIF